MLIPQVKIHQHPYKTLYALRAIYQGKRYLNAFWLEEGKLVQTIIDEKAVAIPYHTIPDKYQAVACLYDKEVAERFVEKAIEQNKGMEITLIEVYLHGEAPIEPRHIQHYGS